MSHIVVVVQPVCWGDFIIVGLFILYVYIYELKVTGFFAQATSAFKVFFSYLHGRYRLKRQKRLELKKERKRRNTLQKHRRRRRLYRHLKKIWLYKVVVRIFEKDLTT